MAICLPPYRNDLGESKLDSRREERQQCPERDDMESCAQEESLALVGVGQLLHHDRCTWTDAGRWVDVVAVMAAGRSVEPLL